MVTRVSILNLIIGGLLCQKLLSLRICQVFIG